MGKASSAKKVARAARAGGGARTKQRREGLLFPVTIVLIFILGIAVFLYARNDRTNEQEQALGEHPVAGPVSEGGDHWHAAYAVRLCGQGFQAPFLSDQDPNGIHSHADGVIHIHPFGSAAAGDNAQLGVFFDAMGVTIDDDTIDLGNDVKVEEGEDTCGENDREGIVQVAKWENAREAQGTEPDEIITEDIQDIHFDNDSEAYTIAFAPEGAEIPPPPSIPQLDQLTDLETEQNPTGTTVPNPATATTAVAPGGTTATTARSGTSDTTTP